MGKDKFETMAKLMDSGEPLALRDKIRLLQYGIINGQLYVGKEQPKWKIVKDKKTGELHCSCPEYIFRQKQKGGACKHLVFVYSNNLEHLVK